MKNNKEREYIQLKKKEMDTLKEILKDGGIKLGNKCHYCKTTIKKTDKYSIFNKPDRIVCNNILCVTEAISEDDDD